MKRPIMTEKSLSENCHWILLDKLNTMTLKIAEMQHQTDQMAQILDQIRTELRLKKGMKTDE